MNEVPATRILIYGVTGAGKTTLAAAVAHRTGLPWHSVDSLTWEPGWNQVPAAEQRRRISAICAGERWILDTAYSGWVDVVIPRTEIIVGLDYPRWLSLSRVVRRTAGRIIDRRLICNGNVETIRGTLSHDSIIAWHFRSFKRKRARMRGWAEADLRADVVLLRSPRAAELWLARLPRGT